MESYLPSPALSLSPAVGVTAWEVLKQHGDGDARFGREPVAAQIPLSHDTAALVLGSRTALLTYTCTGNVAFQAHLLATQCSCLGSQTRWLLLNSFHVAVSGGEENPKYKSKTLLLLLLVLLLLLLFILLTYCPFQALTATTISSTGSCNKANIVGEFLMTVFTFYFSLFIYFKEIVSLATCLNPQLGR